MTYTSTVYIVKDSKVLLHLHKKYKTWFAIGGHIENGEFAHSAAIREAKEETGLDIELVDTEATGYVDLVNVGRLKIPFMLLHEGIGSDEEFMDFIYIATTKTDKLKPEGDESKTLRWFSKSELESEAIKPHIKNTALAVLEYLEKRL